MGPELHLRAVTAPSEVLTFVPGTRDDRRSRRAWDPRLHVERAVLTVTQGLWVFTKAHEKGGFGVCLVTCNPMEDRGCHHRGLLVAAVVAGASALSTASASVAAFPPVDHQLCYTAAGVQGPRRREAVRPVQPERLRTEDQPPCKLALQPRDQVAPDRRGAIQGHEPESAPGLLPDDGAGDHRTPKVQVTNQFGQAILAPSTAPNGVCLPSWKSLAGPLHLKPTAPPKLNHFTCYPVKLVSGGYKPPTGLWFATSSQRRT